MGGGNSMGGGYEFDGRGGVGWGGLRESSEWIEPTKWA